MESQKQFLLWFLSGFFLRLIDFISLVVKEKARVAGDIKDHQIVVFFRDFLKVLIGHCRSDDGSGLWHLDSK